MRTMTINRPTSTFAKELTDYQHSFYKETSEDKSIGGLIKYHIVGTILTSSITLILHAEAVRRAVIICFLSIRTAFSQSNTELLETQQKEWTFAYSQSLRSFCALFNGNMLLSRNDPPQASSPERLKAIDQEEEPARQLVEIQDQAAPLPAQALFEEVQENGEEEAVDQRVPELRFPEPALAPVEQTAEANGLFINGADSARGEDNGEFHEIGYHSDSSQGRGLGPLSPHRSEDGVLVSLPGSARGSHNGSDSSIPALFPPGILSAPAPDHLSDAILVSPPGSARKSDSGSDGSVPAFAPPGILPDLYPLADGVLVTPPDSGRKSNSSNGAFSFPDIEREVSGDRLDSLSVSEPGSRKSSDGGFEHVEYPPPDRYTGLLQLPSSSLEFSPEESLIIISEPNALPKILTPDEESTLKNQMEEEERQHQEVAASLQQEILAATAQVSSGDREIPHHRAPADLQDSRWTLSNGYIGRHQVGHCNFATEQHVLGAQHLALLLPLQIGSTQVLTPAFGLFDPQIGPKAAEFLVKSLPGVLQTELSHFNRGGLTQVGIWNALNQTLTTLNRDFIRTNKKTKVSEESPEVIANHGASVALVFILDGAIWVSHLGNTKVALDNGGTAVQMTTNNAATGFGRYDLRGTISSKPVITQFPMTQLKEGSHLLIETVGIAEATSTARQIDWVHADREADARKIAQNVSYSIYRDNQKSEDPEVRNRALSTMLIKLNVIPDEEET